MSALAAVEQKSQRTAPEHTAAGHAKPAKIPPTTLFFTPAPQQLLPAPPAQLGTCLRTSAALGQLAGASAFQPDRFSQEMRSDASYTGQRNQGSHVGPSQASSHRNTQQTTEPCLNPFGVCSLRKGGWPQRCFSGCAGALHRSLWRGSTVLATTPLTYHLQPGPPP